MTNRGLCVGGEGRGPVGVWRGRHVCVLICYRKDFTTENFRKLRYFDIAYLQSFQGSHFFLQATYKTFSVPVTYLMYLTVALGSELGTSLLWFFLNVVVFHKTTSAQLCWWFLHGFCKNGKEFLNEYEKKYPNLETIHYSRSRGIKYSDLTK